jgi:carboxyl-terminal processing protease
MKEQLRTKIFLLCISFLILLTNPLFAKTGTQNKDDIYKYLKLFSQVLRLIQTSYVKDVKSKDLIYGAIQGMLNTLDPYSTLLKPDEYKELEIETKGSFTGIGIVITIKDDILTVVAPIEDTPAWRAGIKAGDKILKIDGKSTKGMSLLEAVKLLRGPKGTKVTITILRNDKDIKNITLVRDVIPIVSVKSKFIKPAYGYIRITSFQENTPRELVEKLKKLEKEHQIKGLIIDLRNNPGGLLSSAIDVADEFLEKGIIVSVKGKKEKNKMIFRAHPNPAGRKHHYPIVILINHGTASASEIVTGALKDNYRAVVIGQKSFGKGCVQTVIPLQDGYAVKLTTAYYYTPSGKCIDKIGIKPDIEVPEVSLSKNKKKEKKEKVFGMLPPLENDIQIKIALSILKNIKDISKLNY